MAKASYLNRIDGAWARLTLFPRSQRSPPVSTQSGVVQRVSRWIHFILQTSITFSAGPLPRRLALPCGQHWLTQAGLDPGACTQAWHGFDGLAADSSALTPLHVPIWTDSASKIKPPPGLARLIDLDLGSRLSGEPRSVLSANTITLQPCS